MHRIQIPTIHLDVLFRAAKEVTAPLFFLIASRPEIHIRDAFNEPFHNSFTLRIVLDDAYRPDADIKLFLESRFRDIKQKHSSLSQLQPPWPSEPDIARLVQKSSGQFIYASTVMKYIDSQYYWPPDRLNVIFGLSAPGDDIPFASWTPSTVTSLLQSPILTKSWTS
ncbi:hypothetical protein BDZ97DRAFT_782800 [Flammula alnicola]|nr:hypothetical protein BDZ97DRAFT_782800 [Flammula alnicola]